MNEKSFLQVWGLWGRPAEGLTLERVAPLPPSSSRPDLGSKHPGVRTGGRNHHSAASTENNRLRRGAGPRPPYGATTIPPPSTLLQTHRVLGISSSMAAAVAAAPQGPAPCPSLPPKLLRQLWLRKSRPPRLTGGCFAFFSGGNNTKTPGRPRTMKARSKMAASRTPRAASLVSRAAHAHSWLLSLLAAALGFKPWSHLLRSRASSRQGTAQTAQAQCQ